MDFDLTDEQAMLRDGVERYIREHYAFEARRKLAASPEGFSREHWRQFAELGWLGLMLPEDVGGLDCSFVEVVTVLEAFGRGMVLEPYLTTALLCARIVDRSGSQAHRQTLLPALIEGNLLLALADSEGGSRYRLGCVDQTRARRSGSGYVLEGAKTLVFNAPSADKLIVTARLDGEAASPALFLVGRDAPGCNLRSYRVVDGSRAADVEFRRVELGADALLVGPDLGKVVLDDAVDRATVGVVAQILGVMEAVIELSAQYLKTRVQFGRPIGRFQALQHIMADMFVEAHHTRSMLYRAMAYFEKSPVERSRAVSAAKAAAGKAGRFVCGQGIQLHGGIGMTEEYPVGHCFRSMTLLERQFGDIDYHLERFAAEYRQASSAHAASAATNTRG